MADLQSRFHLTFFFLIFLSYVSANRLFKLSDHMYGGLSEAKPANYEIQKLIDLVSFTDIILLECLTTKFHSLVIPALFVS